MHSVLKGFNTKRKQTAPIAKTTDRAQHSLQYSQSLQMVNVAIARQCGELSLELRKEILSVTPRQRLSALIESRWFDLGKPSLMKQHKYSILLRSIREEKKLVAMELIDLMLEDTSNKLDTLKK